MEASGASMLNFLSAELTWNGQQDGTKTPGR